MLRRIKHQAQADLIINKSFQKGSLSQSLLFLGESGAGKSTLALYLAGLMHCKAENKPCGICDNCVKIINFTHPDVIFINTDNTADKLLSLQKIIGKYGINPEISKEIIFILRDILYRINNEYLTNTGTKNKKKKTEIENLGEHIMEYILGDDRSNAKIVNEVINKGIKLSEQINIDNIPADSIRSLMQRLSKSSFGGKITLIISGIEKMRSEGANAFLKTLEEPPLSSRIVLITDKPHLVLPTIKSRCFLIHFNRLSNEQVISIAQENWKLYPESVSDYGHILSRIACSTAGEIVELFEKVFPNFSREYLPFVDKIMKTDKFENFVFEITRYLQITNNAAIVDKFAKIPVNKKIEFQNTVDILNSTTQTNNGDKKIVLETIISMLYSLWRLI